MKIVLIDWVDAQTAGGWQDGLKCKAEVARVRSVGFLLDESDEAITLAQSLTEDNRSNDITIPVICISNIVDLEAV